MESQEYNESTNKGDKSPEEVPVSIASALRNLATILGVIETEKMTQLRNEIVRLMKNEEEFVDVYLEYDELAKEVIDQQNGGRSAEGQIALILLKASMLYDGGDSLRCEVEIDDALVYASNMQYDDVVRKINKITVSSI